MPMDLNDLEDKEYQQQIIAACYKPLARILMRLHNQQIKEAVKEAKWLFKYLVAATGKEGAFSSRGCCPMCGKEKSK